jgi:predicted transcriptional regulator
MMTTLRPIDIFRSRLRALVLEQFDGKYTLLAKRANIPISTLEHTMLEAKRLPGGDHLMRIADVLGVTVDSLIAPSSLPESAVVMRGRRRTRGA